MSKSWGKCISNDIILHKEPDNKNIYKTIDKLPTWFEFENINKTWSKVIIICRDNGKIWEEIRYFKNINIGKNIILDSYSSYLSLDNISKLSNTSNIINDDCISVSSLSTTYSKLSEEKNKYIETWISENFIFTNSDSDFLFFYDIENLFKNNYIDKKLDFNIKNLSSYLKQNFNNYRKIKDGKLIYTHIKIFQKPKYKKKNIPKTLRYDCWIKYIGNNVKGNCYCCLNNIEMKNYSCGHIIPEIEGGESIIENLRPICSSCNSSMKTQNLILFKKKYYPDNCNDFDINYIEIN